MICIKVLLAFICTITLTQVISLPKNEFATVFFYVLSMVPVKHSKMSVFSQVNDLFYIKSFRILGFRHDEIDMIRLFSESDKF